METDNKFHYCVLFTQAAKQEKLKIALGNAFPKDRGMVFIPSMEWWRRGKNEMQLKRLFPGYVFIRSDMGVCEMHEFIRAHRSDVCTFIKELGMYEKRVFGENILDDNGDDYELKDLTEEETRFLNCMLDESGIIRMSSGYRENDRYVVMEGPLKTYEERIADVDKHNRMAYLNFKAIGHVAKVGMQLMPKRHWFPDDKTVPMLLGDGTEVDLRKLSKRMMGG